MIKAVLFDLDGTLLPLDIDEFIARYIPRLHSRFAQYAPLDEFARKLMASTRKMIENNDPSRTLAEVFWADFSPLIGVPVDKLLPVARDFYARDFAKLQGCVGSDPAALRAVDTALEAGYRIVLATNPLFPRAALVERMRWAGVLDTPWELITVQEDTCFAKPNTNYYLSIAKSLRLEPHECVMIGNDTRDDLVASQIGMKTFLVDGFHIKRQNGYHADWQGSLDDLTMLTSRRFEH